MDNTPDTTDVRNLLLLPPYVRIRLIDGSIAVTMAPPLVSTRRNNIKMEESESGEEPLAGMVISVILAMISLVIISSFLSEYCLLVNSDSVSGCGAKLTHDSLTLSPNSSKVPSGQSLE